MTRTEAFRTWLVRLHDTGFAHGAELVDYLACHSDSNAIADRLLQLTVAAGWAHPVAEKPTRDQAFFSGESHPSLDPRADLGREDWGGLQYVKRHVPGSVRVRFGFEPNRDSEAFERYARERGKMSPDDLAALIP